jgi:outer membrane lipopolysaccharide assembly protein LptE/RlpB
MLKRNFPGLRKLQIVSSKLSIVLLIAAVLLLQSCHIYSFKDVSIPPEVKTVKISFIENRARYVDPTLSPQLTDRLQQKITGQTRLTRTNNDDAHYQIGGFVSDDVITTAGISSQQAATNRLTITVHIIFRNTLLGKTDEFDVTRNFDFSAGLTRQQAEGQLHEEILKNLTDEIFNHIFSNW